MQQCFKIHPEDNVATLMEDARAGELQVVGGPSLSTLEPISLGHKVSLLPIACDSPVIKYGVTIGLATRDIQPGEWVHLHNCRSRLDERSSTLDPHTGVPNGKLR
jgi:altronate dehydratase small subunit